MNKLINNYILLSFDIGIKNLSFILLDFNKLDNSIKIIDWKLVNIHNKKFDKQFDNLITFLKNTFENINLDYVIIENQGNKNQIMKTIQIAIYTFFKIKNIQTFNKHAINKLTCNFIPNNLKEKYKLEESTKNQKYTINKKLSIDYINYILNTNILDKYVNINENKSDLADCLIQGLNFLLTLNKKNNNFLFIN